MYLQRATDSGVGGLGACQVPTGVILRHLVCTDADRAAIGTALGLGRAATLAEVRTTIIGAITRARTLIARAAAPLRRPRATGAAGESMRLAFRDAFGTHPEFVPPGERWEGGAVVRERLRCASKIMSEGDIHFVAWGPLSCPFAYAWAATTWAVVEAGRYRICLGQRFWQAAREGDVDGLATTLLHECLHIYFDTIRHRLERWAYNRAACYERYVLVANGLPVPDAVSGPCASGIPRGDFPAPVRGRTGVAGLGRIGAPAVDCAPEPGEVALSHTDAGVLTKDVEVTGKGVLIADFGVNWRHVKPGVKSELADVLKQLETDPSITSIRITGFDDCLRASPQVHSYLRRMRAHRVRDLLGPKARSRLTFVGGAPLGTFFGPNTDRAARARNRSVLIEFVRNLDFPAEEVVVPPCAATVMQRALDLMAKPTSFSPLIGGRLRLAIKNSMAQRDDSFIRPGSTGWMFPFHWSRISTWFDQVCRAAGGASAVTDGVLARRLVELDADLINGVASLEREEKKFSSILDKKALLATNFRGRLNALLKNKSQSAYAGY